jgi:hypothetical protein
MPPFPAKEDNLGRADNNSNNSRLSKHRPCALRCKLGSKLLPLLLGCHIRCTCVANKQGTDSKEHLPWLNNSPQCQTLGCCIQVLLSSSIWLPQTPPLLKGEAL